MKKKNQKAYRVHKSSTLIVEKIINVKFDDFVQTNRRLSNLKDDFVNILIKALEADLYEEKKFRCNEGIK